MYKRRSDRCVSRQHSAQLRGVHHSQHAGNVTCWADESWLLGLALRLHKISLPHVAHDAACAIQAAPADPKADMAAACSSPRPSGMLRCTTNRTCTAQTWQACFPAYAPSLPVAWAWQQTFIIAGTGSCSEAWAWCVASCSASEAKLIWFLEGKFNG